MAIENNKKSDLAADFDDSPNANLDTLTVESLHTTNFPARSESIGRLRIDIQQLRSRWSGLEKEIKAREALTEKLNRRLTDTQWKLEHAESEQSTKEAENFALRSSLKDKLSLLTSVEKEAKQVSETVESGNSLIQELQSRIDEQQSTIDKLSEQNRMFVEKKKDALAALENKEEQIVKLKTDASFGDSDSLSQDHALSTLRKELGSALLEIDHLRASLHSDRAPERRENNRRINDQGDLIFQNQQEINTLKTQIVRTESYADELRTRLQDTTTRSGDEQHRRNQLEISLRQVCTQVQDLKEQLENESLVANSLREKNDAIQRGFETEVKKVRGELGTTEQTLAGLESLSEQLASELIDNQSYRLALESQLKDTETESQKTIGGLTRKLNRLEVANKDIERQIENKDNAIAALLNELATRSRTIESAGETDNVIHEIDGRLSGSAERKSNTARDPVARLLIGNVEGQELQFPLFKDRLTIGRTAHNDIQLKAHFISRRHALIVTEDGESRIVDWGSKNGVYVNDSRVAEQTLRNGDIVSIGTAEFRYEERLKR